jgi:hypothetical protein
MPELRARDEVARPTSGGPSSVSFLQYAHCIIWFEGLIGVKNAKILRNLVGSIGMKSVAKASAANVCELTSAAKTERVKPIDKLMLE